MANSIKISLAFITKLVCCLAALEQQFHSCTARLPRFRDVPTLWRKRSLSVNFLALLVVPRWPCHANLSEQLDNGRHNRQLVVSYGSHRGLAV